MKTSSARMQQHLLDEHAPAWEAMRCTEACCQADLWVVKRRPDRPDLWWVARTQHDTRWTIAATAPLCPWCGAALMLAIQQERSAAGSKPGV